mmetsp:Transcript_116159/g.375330  ORF Transcript_116159/g.375330 Transcript_116159/m.375330 type:complete len:322 (-) Transcript_116159:78-1043(-)
MHGRRSSTRMPRQRPPRQSRTRYAPSRLSLACSGSSARTKRPPWNSASAASEERNQQSPSSPCSTSSARGLPRKSCQSAGGGAGVAPANGFQLSSALSVWPSCRAISWGRHHWRTWPRILGVKSGSVKRPPACWHFCSTRCSSAIMPSGATAVASAAGSAGALRRTSRNWPGKTHLVPVPPRNTTFTDPAGILAPSAISSASMTSCTTPSSIHRPLDLLQTCTASPRAGVHGWDSSELPAPEGSIHCTRSRTRPSTVSEMLLSVPLMLVSNASIPAVLAGHATAPQAGLLLRRQGSWPQGCSRRGHVLRAQAQVGSPTPLA